MLLKIPSSPAFNFNEIKEQAFTSFSVQQKKIATIAFAALALFTAYYLISRFCFKSVIKKHTDDDKKDAPAVKTEVQKIEDVKKDLMTEANKEEPKIIVDEKDSPKEVKKESTKDVKKNDAKDMDVKKDLMTEAKKEEPKIIVDEKDSPKEVKNESPKDVKKSDAKDMDVKKDDVKEEIKSSLPKARIDHLATFVPPDHWTVKEQMCAKKILGEWMNKYPPGNAFHCFPMNSELVELERKKMVLNYLLEKGLIAAWVFGWSSVPLVKAEISDRAPPLKYDGSIETGFGFQNAVDPSSWRTQQTLEDEKRFKQKNFIDPSLFSDEEFEELKDKNVLLHSIIKDLNTRITDRPHPILNQGGEELAILEFLLKKKLIGGFKEEITKWPNHTVSRFLVDPL